MIGRLNTNEDNENMLGYELYSSALADMLSEPSLSMPITVGLYAKWGSGKSFLLSKLRGGILLLLCVAQSKNNCIEFVRWNEGLCSSMDWATVAVFSGPLYHGAPHRYAIWCDFGRFAWFLDCRTGNWRRLFFRHGDISIHSILGIWKVVVILIFLFFCY